MARIFRKVVGKVIKINLGKLFEIVLKFKENTGKLFAIYSKTLYKNIT